MKKKSVQFPNSDVQKLQEAILNLRTLPEVRDFLRDLLTESEIHEFSLRFKAAVMLEAGIKYVDIEHSTGLSSTTVARVHKWLKNGTGGYRNAIQQIQK